MALMKLPKHSVAGYDLERDIAGSRSLVIAGLDEVGRGAWAGPVVVCAAIARGVSGTARRADRLQAADGEAAVRARGGTARVG